MNQIYPFFFNGQKYLTKQNITIFELIQYFGYNESLLVVEYNKFICNKKEWKNTYVQKNDTIEIVTIVGGG